MINIQEITKFIDNYLENTNQAYLKAPEANKLLADREILPDSDIRPGLPLRRLLRKNKLPHAYQDGVTWKIPHSSKSTKLKSKPKILENISFEAIRNRYRPEQVQVLFIGESPPAGKTFFYNKNSNLFKYTKEAFQNALNRNFNDEDFLIFFKREGYFLDDLCITPINHSLQDQRKKQRKLGEEPIAHRIGEYSPTSIICVMKAIEKHVARSIETSNLTSVNLFSLPFPAFGNHKKYVQGLSALISNHDLKPH